MMGSNVNDDQYGIPLDANAVSLKLFDRIEPATFSCEREPRSNNLGVYGHTSLPAIAELRSAACRLKLSNALTNPRFGILFG
jgi:hypothetical protein